MYFHVCKNVWITVWFWNHSWCSLDFFFFFFIFDFNALSVSTLFFVVMLWSSIFSSVFLAVDSKSNLLSMASIRLSLADSLTPCLANLEIRKILSIVTKYHNLEMVVFYNAFLVWMRIFIYKNNFQSKFHAFLKSYHWLKWLQIGLQISWFCIAEVA